MTTKYLRHKPSGVLYAYQAVFAQRMDFEAVPDEDDAAPTQPATRARRRKATEATDPPVVDDEATKATDPPVVDDEALGRDASRNLP